MLREHVRNDGMMYDSRNVLRFCISGHVGGLMCCFNDVVAKMICGFNENVEMLCDVVSLMWDIPKMLWNVME